VLKTQICVTRPQCVNIFIKIGKLSINVNVTEFLLAELNRILQEIKVFSILEIRFLSRFSLLHFIRYIVG